MKKNNLSLDFSLENRIYHKTFKKVIKIILIYLIFKFILSLYFMYNVHMFKQEFLYGKKEFHAFEGEFSNISDVYKQIRENYRSFDVNSYIEDKEDVDGKTVYHLYKNYKGAKILDGYEIVIKDNRFKVTKVENKKFDIKVDDALSKFGIDRYLKYRENKTGEKLKVIKTEFIHQDDKFYNRYEVEVSFDEKKSRIFLYEEKYVGK